MDYCEIFIIVCLVVMKDILGLTIVSFGPTGTGILGPSNVNLICSYIPAQEDVVDSISIHAGKNNLFDPIAILYPPGGPDPIIASNGSYLKDRVKLTNPTSKAANFMAQAIITFNEIKCEDETQYKCSISLQHLGTPQTQELLTRIVVKAIPAMPDSIPSLTPKQGIEDGMDVWFTCTGNVGKPAGMFRWTKYRGPVAIDYTGVTNTAVPIPGTCTYNGTSVFTTRLEAEDNNAVIRCTVEHELATPDTLYNQTEPESLVVYYKVRKLYLAKNPNKPSFAEGSGKITLTCLADGNPAPSYKWYNSSDSVIGTGNTLVVSDQVNNTGNYTCVASNSFNGKMFNQIAALALMIDRTTTPSPITTPSASPDPRSLQVTSTDLTSGNARLHGVAVFLIVLQLAEVFVQFRL